MSYWIESNADIVVPKLLPINLLEGWYISNNLGKRRLGPYNTRIEAEDELSDMIARGILIG